ncbi:hypothetical protein M9Y10_025479 [Tritrichomonas musculus]|uniref:BTB domain-containing protein n=1 Tax=Tritrichomonas musculus TaxID=1915356 RepID=A0ABR2H8S5_9EUKA
MKNVRPSKAGAKKKKRRYLCTVCHRPNHNKKTCMFNNNNKSDELINRDKDVENEEVITNDGSEEESSDSIEEDQNLNEIDILNFDDETNNDSSDSDIVEMQSINNETENIDQTDDELNDGNNDDQVFQNNSDFVDNDFFGNENIQISLKERETYMRKCTKNQLLIINKCPEFERFLKEITDPKDSEDGPTNNGIYYTQYHFIKEYIFNHPDDFEVSEEEVVKLIFEVNFKKPIKKKLFPEIIKMCNYNLMINRHLKVKFNLLC